MYSFLYGVARDLGRVSISRHEENREIAKSIETSKYPEQIRVVEPRRATPYMYELAPLLLTEQDKKPISRV